MTDWPKTPRTLVERLRAKANGRPYGRTEDLLREAAQALEEAEKEIRYLVTGEQE